MAGQEFKATEKSVLKNTRDGAMFGGQSDNQHYTTDYKHNRRNTNWYNLLFHFCTS